MAVGSQRDPQIARLTYASIAGSLAMAVGLVIVYIASGSQLALAQAADSISDMFAGAALAWAVAQASRPPDLDHPLGHGPAEPLAALVVALLAGVLSVEVLRNAIGALLGNAEPRLDWPVAAMFAAKIGFKGVIVVLSGRALARRGNPALAALRVDARNDVLVGGVALVGFALARWRLPAIDAGLAIALALYVGLSGVRLARANVGLVMSEAAPLARKEELMRAAAGVDGVLAIDGLVPTWAGASLHVYVEIAVDGATSVQVAHEIAHRVEARLMRENDVTHVVVHVGPAVSP